jgi:hypothetical protein
MASEVKAGIEPAKMFFTAGGKSYSLRLDHATIRRLKAECGWDFYGLADDGEALTRDCYLFNHKMIPVLAVWLKSQIDSHGLTADQFADAFDGGTLEAATLAVWSAFADFFRRHPMSLRVAEKGAAAVLSEVETAIRRSMTGTDGSGSR